jgi:hypothetical protein
VAPNRNRPYSSRVSRSALPAAPTPHDLHCVTERAVDLVRIGFSVSDAIALAVMGKCITAAAVNRVETIVTVLTAGIVPGSTAAAVEVQS